MNAAHEVKWVSTHKKLKSGETVYTGDQAEWFVGAESPPGPEKEKSAPEKDRLKFAADNDTYNVNYNGITTNPNPQLCADGLPEIVNIEKFEAEVFDDNDKRCPDCNCVMEECHCWDEDSDEDGSAVQACLVAVREVWAKNPIPEDRFVKKVTEFAKRLTSEQRKAYKFQWIARGCDLEIEDGGLITDEHALLPTPLLRWLKPTALLYCRLRAHVQTGGLETQSSCCYTFSSPRS
jgi:hypothetical protein